MYKKNYGSFLLMAVLTVVGAFDVLAQNTSPKPPPISHLIRGNWNHVMNPDGCVVLDVDHALRISVRISVGTTNLSAYPPLFYTTQFQGGDIEMIGPITGADLIAETLDDGCQVLTYVKQVYKGNFSEECNLDLYTPIPFSYNIELVDEFGNPYPIEANMGLLNDCQIAQAQMGNGEPWILPTIDYSGNKDLCCEEPMAGQSGYVVIENDMATIANGGLSAAVNAPVVPTITENLELPINVNSTANRIPQVVVSPNPFQETLRINFEATEESTTIIQLWNINGQLVAEMERRSLANGLQATNLSTAHLSPDIYFCSIKNDSWSQIIKVIKL